jgi:hypothetical protein
MQSISQVRGRVRALQPSYIFKRDWMLLASVGAMTITFLVFTIGHAIMPTPDDVELYYQYANRVLGQEIPYRDFNIEYPPFSVPFFVFPAIFSNSIGAFSPERYILLFQAQSYVLALATLFLVWNMLRKVYFTFNLNWRIFYFSFATILISLYIFRRFDITAVFLVALAFYFVYNQRPGWGGIMLGLATAAKLYPAVIVPILILYFWRGKNDQESAKRLGVGFTFAGMAVTLPFLITGLPGMLNFLKYHSERGVQIESLFASFIWIGRETGFTTAVSENGHGALNLVSSWSQTLALVSTPLTVGGLLVFYVYLWWVTRPGGRRLRADWLILAASLAILWFILANKVLSPQYLVWLLPLAPFWRSSRVWLYFVTLLLSTIAFPFMVLGVKNVDWQPMLVILARNLLLVVLFGLLLRDFFRISGIPRLRLRPNS